MATEVELLDWLMYWQFRAHQLEAKVKELQETLDFYRRTYGNTNGAVQGTPTVSKVW